MRARAVLIISAIFATIWTLAGAGTALASLAPAAAGPRPGLRAVLARFSRDPAIYDIQAGDTLSGVSARHGMSWQALYCANRRAIGPDYDLITPGTRLRLRGASCQLPVIQPRQPQLLAVTPSPSPQPGTAPAPSQQAAPAAVQAPDPAPYYGAGGSFQQCVISRESGGSATAVNPSSGAGGLYGFLPSTWQSLGYSGLPENASVATQNQAFQKAYASEGSAPWSAFDGC